MILWKRKYSKQRNQEIENKKDGILGRIIEESLFWSKAQCAFLIKFTDKAIQEDIQRISKAFDFSPISKFC